MTRRTTVVYIVLAIFVMACTKKISPAGTVVTKQDSRQTGTQKTGEPADPADKEKGRSTASETAPPPSDAPASTMPKANEKPSAEEMGKSLYSSKCSKCHAAKNVKNYTYNQWEPILKTMIPNAKLTADEESYVLTYIRANSK